MKRVSQLSLLLIAMTLASCNEKVSPKLEEGSTVTPPDPGVVVPPSEYYFQVVNKTAAAANYNLHKTGLNKRNVPCKVNSTSQPFATDSFGVSGVSEAVDNDITCFLEGEELAIFHHGISFEMSASPNTCDFIAYSPYSFYNRIPGDSTGAYTKVTCANETTDATHVANAAAARGILVGTSTTPLDCGDWASQEIDPALRVKFTPPTDADLCRYNYKDKGKEQCDIGTVTVNELTVNFTPGDGTPSKPDVLQHSITTREIQCGGKIKNCVKGAVELTQTESIRPTWITESVINTSPTQTYTLPKLYGASGSSSYASNRRYVNYRRNLASFYVDYGFAAYNVDAFNNILNGESVTKTYTPQLTDLYSSNLKVNGDPIISSTDLETYSYPENKYKAVPLAADPFLGVDHTSTDPLLTTGINNAHRVNPFYTFYCLDGAFDIKARIRMVVREWDRLYPSNGNQELLSDIFLGSDARQDNNYFQPVPGGDLSEWIPFNDFNDWDDRIPMRRTDGVLDITTEWSPKDGWFKSKYFPENQL